MTEAPSMAPAVIAADRVELPEPVIRALVAAAVQELTKPTAVAYGDGADALGFATEFVFYRAVRQGDIPAPTALDARRQLRAIRKRQNETDEWKGL